MNILRITFAFLLVALTSCQSIPIERKSHCACNWKSMNSHTDQNTQTNKVLV
jgi:hypothetical protein